MTAAHVTRAHVPLLNDEQWKALQSALSHRREWMVHSLAGQTGIGYREVRGVFLVLDVLELARLAWNVYHGYAEHPIDQVAYREGFIRLPWRCPECERVVMREEELGYELVCEPTGDLTLEDER